MSNINQHIYILLIIFYLIEDLLRLSKMSQLSHHNRDNRRSLIIKLVKIQYNLRLFNQTLQISL